MTVGMILEITFITGDTEVIIRNENENTIAKGSWYIEEIQALVCEVVESFSWYSDDSIVINIRGNA